MESQEVSITRACKLVGSPGDELHVFFLDALLEERIASCQDQEDPYRTPTHLEVHY
jgi:hypothetical protein